MTGRTPCLQCGPGYYLGDDACRHTTAVRLGRPRPAMTKIDQTILLGDPTRKGNCVAACVATIVGLPLDQVPHFIEFGIAWGDDPDVGSVSNGHHWWAMLIGYLAGQGLMVEELTDVTRAAPQEVLLVAGMTERGVMHQVIYLGARLWHDPHPSRAGLTDVREVLAVRPLTHFDHAPTALQETHA